MENELVAIEAGREYATAQAQVRRFGLDVHEAYLHILQGEFVLAHTIMIVNEFSKESRARFEKARSGLVKHQARMQLFEADEEKYINKGDYAVWLPILPEGDNALIDLPIVPLS